jgi:hypothetical protein
MTKTKIFKYSLKHFTRPIFPVDQSFEACEELKEEANEFEGEGRLMEEIQVLHCTYFEGFWCKQIRVNNISCFGVKHRTNNMCEGLYSKVKRKLTQGSNIWNFLSALIENIIEPAKVEVAQLRNGLVPR